MSATDTPTAAAKKNAPAPTSAPDTPAAAAVLPPGVAPLADALAKLERERREGLRTALHCYRELVHNVADGKALTDASAAALAHSLKQLDLTAADFAADVRGLNSYRLQLHNRDLSAAVVAELAPQEREWGAELERMQKRRLEIVGLQQRLRAAVMVSAGHDTEANSLAQHHHRVLADFESAYLRFCEPPTATGPNVTGRDKGPTHMNMTPGLGLSLGTLG